MSSCACTPWSVTCVLLSHAVEAAPFVSAAAAAALCIILMALTSFSCPLHAAICPLSFISVFLLTFLISPSSSQPGFVSIDCGGTSDFVSTRGISWVMDDLYISTGQSWNTTEDPSGTLDTLRYFPEQIPKNCYELRPVEEGRGYLVRAMFYYENFDSKGSMPQFSLIIDATTMLDPVIDETYYDMYVTAKNNISLSVCLARRLSDSNSGDPFISSLELRLLPRSSIYNNLQQLDGYGLISVHTVDLGSNSSVFLRYPNDTMDRLWNSYYAPNDSNIATTQSIVDIFDNPPAMLQTAITGEVLPYPLTGLSSKSKYYVIMFFSEISPNVTRPGQRVFDIYLNAYEGGSLPWFSAVDIYETTGGQFIGTVGYSSRPLTPVDDSMLISFKSSPNSTHPPLISGIQVLHLTEERLSNLTFASDAITIRSIRDYYNISGSVGDPCLPKDYSWSWIGCDTSNIAPRVTSISLSRGAFGGAIYSQISNLPTLTELYLDGNNLIGKIPDLNSLVGLETLNLEGNYLTGPIPEFNALRKLQTLNLQSNNLSGTIPASLGQFPNLRELYLANNRLVGEIPPSLLEKAKAGTLKFTYYGNAKLTCNGVLCDGTMAPPSPPPPPPIPSNAITTPSLSCTTSNALSRFLVFMFVCIFI